MSMLKLVVVAAVAIPLSTFAGGHGDKKMHSFSKLDANGDGVISKEELSQSKYASHFDKLDRDGSGTLSEWEFKKGHKTSDDLMAKADKKMRDLDVQTDVDMKRLETFAHDFSEIDDNDDGFITLVEAQQHALDFHFGYIDEDADYRISEEEFTRYNENLDKEKWLSAIEY